MFIAQTLILYLRYNESVITIIMMPGMYMVLRRLFPLTTTPAKWVMQFKNLVVPSMVIITICLVSEIHARD